MQNDDKRAALMRARANAQLWAERELSPTPKPPPLKNHKPKPKVKIRKKLSETGSVLRPLPADIEEGFSTFRSSALRVAILDLTEQKQSIENSIEVLKKRLNKALIEESNDFKKRKV